VRRARELGCNEYGIDSAPFLYARKKPRDVGFTRGQVVCPRRGVGRRRTIWNLIRPAYEANAHVVLVSKKLSKPFHSWLGSLFPNARSCGWPRPSRDTGL
jgi:hypothetical protein